MKVKTRTIDADYQGACKVVAMQNGYELEQLASKLGMSDRTLKRRIKTVHGERSSLTLLEQIAVALGVTTASVVAQAETIATRRLATKPKRRAAR